MSDVTQVGMSYELLVEEGRAARREVDGYQWRQGDLALEVEHLPPGEGPRDEDGKYVEGDKALRRYAEDIGIGYSAMKDYRATSAAWPVVARATTVSWATHRKLSAQPDRFDLIAEVGTYREADRIVSARTRAASGTPGWDELLGIVGDDLTKAAKALAKAEAEIGEPHTPAGARRLGEKAAAYAERAEDIAQRLRAIQDRMREGIAA